MPSAAVENRNIAAYLPLMAERRPDTLGVVCPHGKDEQGRTRYSFEELNRESDLLAAGLKAYGITRGKRTVLMVTPSLDFFALTFALFKVGAVPVLIDPGMGLKNLKQCLSEAEPEAFIGIPKAHLARLLLGWPKVDYLVTAGTRLFWGGTTLKGLRRLGAGKTFEMPVMADGDQAAILFTSGSTGVPKGALYSHGIFATQVEILRRIYDIRPGEVDLATFPLFALFAPALGMTAIIPKMDFTRPALVDPRHIIDLVNNYKVTNMFGSPALLNRVARFGTPSLATMPSLKRVISAGAPVHASILASFSKMLGEGAEIHTPYGATESLPVATIGSREILAETAAATAKGQGVCVGRPVDEVNLCIIGIDDEPIDTFRPHLVLADGEIGELAVKGPMVTRGYFNRDSSTRLAKMRDPQDGGIWHRMGDVGYRDELGRIWFCGRKAHRVTTAEGDLYTVPIEGVYNAHPAVFRSALVGVGEAGAQKPVLCVEMESSHQQKDIAMDRYEILALGKKIKMCGQIEEILFHPGFPVDIRHNAKIFREKLAIWAAKQ